VTIGSVRLTYNEILLQMDLIGNEEEKEDEEIKEEIKEEDKEKEEEKEDEEEKHF